jgi:hypothetical protein
VAGVQAVVDGGGGRSPADGPFEHYPVSPEQVRAAGDQVTGVGGDVENLAGDVTGAHRVAQHGVAGLLADPMLAAYARVRGQVDQWLRGAVFGGGTIRLFADGIDAYNRGIDGLSQRYQDAKAGRFGVAAPDPEGYASGSDYHQAYAALIAEADLSLLRELERERHSILEPALDGHARMVAGLLDRGPDDATAVLALYQAGALPLTAPAVFTDVDFSGVDPLRLYQNLLASGQLPADLPTMGEDELFDWLTNHPAEAGLLAVLRQVRQPLPAAQTTVLRALGRYDAWVVTRGLGVAPSRAGLALIEQGSARLAQINQRLASGGRLTAADRHYLTAWFDAAGADHLAGLDRYVLAATDIPAGLPGYAAESLIERNRSRYLSPVADAIMNLTNPDRGGVDRLADLPVAIQDLASTPIGELSDNGLRWPVLDESGNPVYAATDPMDFTVAGLASFGGFADLLEPATVDGGGVVSRELGEAALRVKRT